MAAKPNNGDRVAFSSHFLRSMAEAATSPRWGDRGEVVRFECGEVLAVVRWDHGAETTVNAANLRFIQRGAGLNEETEARLGNAWVGMGFSARQSAEA